MASGASNELRGAALGALGREALTELGNHRLPERVADLAINRPAIEVHCVLWQAVSRLGNLHRACQGAARGRQLVDQPDLQGLVGGHRAAGHGNLKGPADANKARKSHGAAVHERHPPPPVEHAEYGIAGGDAQVAPQGEFEAAGYGISFDCADDRLRQCKSRDFR